MQVVTPDKEIMGIIKDEGGEIAEFELGLAKRKAVYRPFPQAVPNIFTIDKRG